MRRGKTLAGLAMLCLAAATACSAQAEKPPGPRSDLAVTLTQVAEGEAPTAGTAGPDGTVWIAERPGRVRLLEEDGLSDQPLLDISDETTTDGERGLLGIAFDDAYEHFYISYTDLEGHTAIDAFAVTDGELDLATRHPVLTQEQPYGNHNGGDLTFGPDGMLYIGLGDGGSGGDPHGNGQNLETLLGTLLRIDPIGDPYTLPSGSQAPPYAIPSDNPFLDDPAARDEIWAYGLRNPWRFSFDASTGDLWIADVGQSDREEVNWVAAGSPGGENYGWSRMEGAVLYSGGEAPEDHVPPVFEYPTSSGRCSVTGGYVYRGSAIPDLQGAYVFSDYCEGEIRTLDLEDGELAGETSLGVNGGAVVAFVQDADHELYVLDLDGAIHRLDPA